MNFIQKKKMLHQFSQIREINYKFIEFANSQLESNHAFKENEIENFKKLEEHLTNLNLIFSRMEDGAKANKG